MIRVAFTATATPRDVRELHRFLSYYIGLAQHQRAACPALLPQLRDALADALESAGGIHGADPDPGDVNDYKAPTRTGAPS